MSAEDFAPSLAHVLVHEGGYSADPLDPGGATLNGITHLEYDAYRRRRGETLQDVRQMSEAERDDIYRSQYWTACRCDDLRPGLDYCVFDAAVNCGVTQATKFLQRCVGVDVDGHLGEQTLASANVANLQMLIHDYCERRRDFYRSLRTFSRFGPGWIRRANEVEEIAKQMSGDAAPVANQVDDGASAKATPTDAQQPIVSPEMATSTTAGTGILSGLTDQLQGLTAQLSPFQSTLNVIKYILIAVAIISAGVSIYAFWKRAKTKEAMG